MYRASFITLYYEHQVHNYNYNKYNIIIIILNLLVIVQNKKKYITTEVKLLPQKFNCYDRSSPVTAEVQQLPHKYTIRHYFELPK